MGGSAITMPTHLLTRLANAARHALVVLSVLSLISGCRNAKRDVLGTWREVGGTERLEFFDDERVAVADGRKSMAGTWTILADGRVKIELAALGSTHIATGTIQNGELVLEANGRISRYARPAEAEVNSDRADSGGDTAPRGGPTESRPERSVSMMQTALRNLVTAQESYYADFRRYASSAPGEGPRGFEHGMLVFNPPDGVTVTIRSADSTGWSATARYAGITRTCSIYVGRVHAIPGATDREPYCGARSSAVRTARALVLAAGNSFGSIRHLASGMLCVGADYVHHGPSIYPVGEVVLSPPDPQGFRRLSWHGEHGIPYWIVHPESLRVLSSEHLSTDFDNAATFMRTVPTRAEVRSALAERVVTRPCGM
jgi:hypothetical protein